MCDSGVGTCSTESNYSFYPDHSAFYAGDTTGVCSPAEVGPVCYGNPSEPWNDAYTTSDWYAHTAPQAGTGMLSFFQDVEPVHVDILHIPEGVDLDFVENQHLLPPQLATTIAPVNTLAMEMEVPISFRVVQVQLSTGETMPQIYFFRNGPGDPAPNLPGRGAAPSATGGANAPQPSSVGMMVGTLGSAAVIVAFDQLVLESLVDNGLIPEEARSPLMFGTVMTAYAALHQAGIVQTPVRGALKSMPAFIGFQTLARLLIQAAPEDHRPELGSAGEQFLGMTLASTPFVMAYGYALQRAAQLEAAGMTAEAAALRQAIMRSPGAAFQASPWALRFGAAFARVLGWLAIIDLGARVGTYGFGRAYCSTEANYDNCVNMWDLVRRSQDVFNQERFSSMMGENPGAVFAGVFGSIITAWDSAYSATIPGYGEWYNGNLDRIRDSYVDASGEFGDGMERGIIAIIGRNTHLVDDGTLLPDRAHATMGDPTLGDGSDLKWEIDWEGVQRDLHTLYQSEDNADNIENGYTLLEDYTGPWYQLSHDQLIEVVEQDGDMSSSTDVRDHLQRRLQILIFLKAQEMNERALELGLMEVTSTGTLIPSRAMHNPERRTAEQTAFLAGEGFILQQDILGMTMQQSAFEQEAAE